MTTRPRPLRSLVLSGFAWSVSTSVVVQLSRIAFGIALARFLTPREYGLATIAVALSGLVFVFTDLSLAVGLVQRSKISEEDRSTVFWTSTGLGALTTAAGILLAGPIASFYGEPEVQPLFAILALSFGIGSLGATHAALLHREMDFRSISIRVGSSSIIGGIVGVLLAAAGFGAWALIVQQLCIAVISTTLLWLSVPWRPRLVYSGRSLRELGSFGGRIFAMRISEYGRTNGDKLLIGRFLGSAPLGAYSVAFSILLSPISRFIIAVTDTLFPALSRLQDDPQRLATVWLRVNRIIAAAFVPALLGLAVVARDFVPVVLGARWGEVAPLLQIMALGVLAQAVSAPGAEVLKALGRASTLMWFTIGETMALLAGILVGLQWGIVGVAAAYALVSVPTRVYFVWLTAHSVGLPFTRFLASLGGVSQASFVLLAATVATKTALADAVPPWLRLVIVIAVGVAVYVPVCLWRVPELRAEIAHISRDVLDRKKAHSPSCGVAGERRPEVSGSLLR